MGQISLQIPQSGQPNTTEDAKVASDLTTIQTAINGNLDDTNLSGPNNGVRRLLLQASGAASPATLIGTFFLGAGQTAPVNGATSVVVPFWAGDSGLSSQPQDFQVAGKTAFGRVRASLFANSVQTGVTYTVGLWQLGFVGGSGANITYNISGTALASSTVPFVAPAAGATLAGESQQFTLPSANFWGLTVGISGANPPANSFVAITAQLYGYNA